MIAVIIIINYKENNRGRTLHTAAPTLCFPPIQCNFLPNVRWLLPF